MSNQSKITQEDLFKNFRNKVDQTYENILEEGRQQVIQNPSRYNLTEQKISEQGEVLLRFTYDGINGYGRLIRENADLVFLELLEDCYIKHLTETWLKGEKKYFQRSRMANVTRTTSLDELIKKYEHYYDICRNNTGDEIYSAIVADLKQLAALTQFNPKLGEQQGEDKCIHCGSIKGYDEFGCCLECGKAPSNF